MCFKEFDNGLNILIRFEKNYQNSFLLPQLDFSKLEVVGCYFTVSALVVGN